MTRLEARFWAKVKKRASGCWEWTGSRDTSGYGLFRTGRLLKAHRFSYILHWGDIREGLVVCHSCDNPCCVNPSHLWVGTKRDNAHDRDQKGRWVQGRGRSKLTLGEARVIRDRLAAGERQCDIARDVALSRTQVSRLALGRTYA